MTKRVFRMSVVIVALATASTAEAKPGDSRRALAETIRSATSKISPSIVTIETIGGAQPVVQAGGGQQVESRFRVADGPTTGLILSADGLIVTSSFNFVRDPSVITVALYDGRRFVAKLLGKDLIRRIAIIKIEAAGLPTPSWLPRAELAVGQYAIACGRGMGGDQPCVSCGIISALDRRNGSALQTDAKTSPANYGGPLVDIDGRVMGIIVPMAGEGSALAGVEWYDSGIAFAVYEHRIQTVLPRLIAGEIIEPGKLGVVLAPDETGTMAIFDQLFPQYRGVSIQAVANPSPAAKAGFEPGDKILALDGQPTGDVPELQRRLSDRAAGEQVTFTIRRDWQTKKLTVKLARLADIGKFGQSPQDSEDKPEPTTQPSSD
jgi:serine protease Do